MKSLTPGWVLLNTEEFSWLPETFDKVSILWLCESSQSYASIESWIVHHRECSPGDHLLILATQAFCHYTVNFGKLRPSNCASSVQERGKGITSNAQWVFLLMRNAWKRISQSSCCKGTFLHRIIELKQRFDRWVNITRQILFLVWEPDLPRMLGGICEKCQIIKGMHCRKFPMLSRVLVL